MTTIIWTEYADKQLEKIFDYISEDNPRAAWRVFGAVREHVERLHKHPKLGKAGRVKGTRELVNPTFPAYMVVYRLVENKAIIIRVYNSNEVKAPPLSE